MSGTSMATPHVTGSSARRAAVLTWAAPDDGGSPLTGYRLYRATSANGSFSQIASPTATSSNTVSVTAGQ